MPSRVGTVFAALYGLPAAVLFASTWYNTKPKYHGYDWVLVSILSVPWSVIAAVQGVRTPLADLVGIVVNSAMMYLFGVLVAVAAYRLAGKRAYPHAAKH